VTDLALDIARGRVTGLVVAAAVYLVARVAGLEWKYAYAAGFVALAGYFIYRYFN
jgi:hypothetical protein